jgi:hypothetical protein
MLFFFETATKREQTNRYMFPGVGSGCCSTDGRLFMVLPNAVHVLCSSETSEQTDYIIWYKNRKGSHHEKKAY